MYRLLTHLTLLLLWGSAQGAAAFDLLAPGDAIIAIDRDYDPPVSSYPEEQSPAQAIDGDINTSYRNFATETSGLIITPSQIHSQVESFTVTTSATNVERDPESYTLYGTFDAVFSYDNGYLGSEHWTLIQSGSLSLPAGRNTESEPILVPSRPTFISYQIVFNSVKDSSTADSVQIAEIQFEAHPPVVLFVDASATGVGDGSSWQDAYADLQSALAAASAGTDLWVAAGVYHPSELSNPDDPLTAVFSLKAGVGLYGGFSGKEVLFGGNHSGA